MNVLKDQYALGASLVMKDDDGRQPIHGAALMGHEDFIEQLVKYGVAVDPIDKNGIQPIHLAVTQNWSECVRTLVRLGAKVDAPSPDNPLFPASGDSDVQPIHYAAAFGYTRTVETLVQLGALIDAKTTKRGKEAIHFAAENGHADMIDVLMGLGSKEDAKDARGLHPIHYAKFNAVIRLVEHGEDMNAVDAEGKTALHHAVQQFCTMFPGKSRKVLKTLFDLGANVNARDDMGKTPLHYAVETILTSSNGLQCARMLQENGADLFEKDSEGVTPADIWDQNSP